MGGVALDGDWNFLTHFVFLQRHTSNLSHMLRWRVIPLRCGSNTNLKKLLTQAMQPAEDEC
eukprot:1699098-Amphidinium_carterae.1